MKDKKVEEVKIDKVSNKNKIITKDRIISVVIGIFIGAIITFGISSICMKTHLPKYHDNQMIQMQDRNKPSTPRIYGKQDRPQHKESNTNGNTQENDNSTQNSN